LKQHLISLLEAVVQTLKSRNTIPADADPAIQLERTRQKGHGDFASNLAMVLTREAGVKPRELAQQIVDALPDSKQIRHIEIAGPGFINFFMHDSALHTVIREILSKGAEFGHSQAGAGRSVQVEFISANPTGPLHVGHGRGAAYGATVASLLERIGHTVHREYYVNDAGRQIDILATSVWLRYLELCGEEFVFPANGYHGAYIYDIAATLHRENGECYRQAAGEVFDNIPADAGTPGGDKEAHIDGLIEKAKTLLDDAGYRKFQDTAVKTILADINNDLEQFGVHYDAWFSERSLVESGKVDAVIALLRKSDHLYEQNGALWFRSSAFGDEKDRVIVRENGQATYFASDIAYHKDKFDRGYEHIINIWGADHHGYVPRVRAAMAALGEDPKRLDVLLVQFAILWRGGEKIQMSTRSGEFVTLRELRDEVGNDAARFFYIMRKSDQHMDFDLDLAKSQSNDNPVYYIQYAHARICSVFKQLAEKGLDHDPDSGESNLDQLVEEHETELMNMLSRYPEILESAAENLEPHLVGQYLRDLAYKFHTYYGSHIFLTDEPGLRDARLVLISATRRVIANGLTCLGVSAPQSM